MSLNMTNLISSFYKIIKIILSFFKYNIPLNILKMGKADGDEEDNIEVVICNPQLIWQSLCYASIKLFNSNRQAVLWFSFYW